MKSFNEIQKEYNFEMDRIERVLKEKNPKSVLIQLPDGLKIYATQIVDFLEKKFPDVLFKIWLGSCFGACDIPTTNSGLIIQFGHAKWRKFSAVKICE